MKVIPKEDQRDCIECTDHSRGNAITITLGDITFSICRRCVLRLVRLLITRLGGRKVTTYQMPKAEP